MSIAKEIRKVLRRLANLRWSEAPQSIRHSRRSQTVPTQSTERSLRTKKRPQLASTAKHCRAWAAANHKDQAGRIAAEALATKIGDAPVTELTQLPCLELVSEWQRKYSIAWTYSLAQRLRRVLRYLEEVGAPPGISARIPKQTKPRAREVIATHEQTARLFAEAEPEMRAFLHMTVDCGMRFSEALRAAPIDFNPTTDTVGFWAKGGRRHYVPVPPQLAQIFRDTPGERTEPLVSLLHGKGHFTQAALRYHWRALLKRCGIEAGSLRPHDLRRTVAVELYESTKDIRAVQQLLGHKNMETTLHYLEHRDAEKLSPLMRKIWTPRK